MKEVQVTKYEDEKGILHDTKERCINAEFSYFIEDRLHHSTTLDTDDVYDFIDTHQSTILRFYQMRMDK